MLFFLSEHDFCIEPQSEDSGRVPGLLSFMICLQNPMNVHVVGYSQCILPFFITVFKQIFCMWREGRGFIRSSSEMVVYSEEFSLVQAKINLMACILCRMQGITTVLFALNNL